jgi:hypothetical protein
MQSYIESNYMSKLPASPGQKVVFSKHDSSHDDGKTKK